jgi:hypothetical protein
MKTLKKYQRSIVTFVVLLTAFCTATYLWFYSWPVRVVLGLWTFFGLSWLWLVATDSRRRMAVILACLIGFPIGTSRADERPVAQDGAVAIGVGIGVLVAGGIFVWWFYGKCKKAKENPPKRGWEKEMEDQDTHAAAKTFGQGSCAKLAGLEDEEGTSVVLRVQSVNGEPRIVGASLGETTPSSREIYGRMQSLGIPPDPWTERYARNGISIPEHESIIHFLDDGSIQIDGENLISLTIEESLDMEHWYAVQRFIVPDGMTGELWVEGKTAKTFWRVQQ